MKAYAHTRYGGPEQLSFVDRPDPVPGKSQVLVEVHAAAVDSGTLHLMQGQPYLVRPYSGLRRARRFPVPGRDLAGVVTALGADVTGVAVGDEVIGTANGSLAELAVVPLERLAPKPASLDFVEAATLPISGVTALQAVRDHGRVEAGQRVLITGASGGVGSFAVQLAIAVGAEVTGVCSASKADFVSGLGATRVLDYAGVGFADELTAGAPYDVVLDLAGNTPVRRLRRLLTPRGTLVIIGNDQAGPVLGGQGRTLGAVLLSPFVRHRLTGLVASESGADMAELGEHVERDTLRPRVHRVFDIADAPAAIAELQSGRVRGKVAVRVR